MLVLLNIMPNALMIMVGLSTARKISRMIQTRIPPLTKTLVLISDRLASFIVLHVLANGTQMTSHNPLL